MAKIFKSSDDTFSAQELASESGESYDTINHWARIGLLPYKKRGKMRLFSATDSLARCRKIRELQEEGHNLTTVGHMLSARN